MKLFGREYKAKCPGAACLVTENKPQDEDANAVNPMESQSDLFEMPNDVIQSTLSVGDGVELSVHKEPTLDEMTALQCLMAVPDHPILIDEMPYCSGLVNIDKRHYVVYIVDFNAVKIKDHLQSEDHGGDNDPMDTVEGANTVEAPGLCKLVWGEQAPAHKGVDEVYIDGNLAHGDWWPVCVHEVTEADEMNDGLTYDQAHPRANVREKIIRQRLAGLAK
jgi:hypothetical protein